MNDMTRIGWLSDPIGRIRNISLAPSPQNTLQPMFEAVMNSVHAIEERFGRDQLSRGVINVRMTEDDGKSYNGFVIEDNGIGLTEENLTAFQKFDTMRKIKIGGKGVGRLLWLKVADNIFVESGYQEGDFVRGFNFNFRRDSEHAICDLTEVPGAEEIGTTINLTPLKAEYAKHIPAKLETIAAKTVGHFINYFTNADCPRITLSDSNEEINLISRFTEDVVQRDEYEISISINDQNQSLSLNCFLVPKKYPFSEKSRNGISFGANGRAVTRYEMDNQLGIKVIDGQYAFFGHLEGSILDDSVNETRTSFSLGDETIKCLERECIEKAKIFLNDEIERVRERQIQTIIDIRKEHLRFLNIAHDPPELVKKMALSTQKEEDIFVEMSRQSFRQYKKVRKEFSEAQEGGLMEIDEQAKMYVAALKEESTSSLAEYVYKRKLILDSFIRYTEFKDKEEKKHHYERVVHELICPLNSTTDDMNYEDHNLWIIDDRLAFYSYFNSDKKLRKQVESTDGDRPDITFFDLGIGFGKSATSDPITIIEFKRPGRDDYDMQNNPFLQATNYVTKMRESGKAKYSNGKTMRFIDDNTPFMCQIIADDTKSLKNVMDHMEGFHKKAASGSYYRWSSNFKIFMEVTSYDDLINGARARQEAFLERLGVKP